MNIFNDLKRRGLIAQMSDPEATERQFGGDIAAGGTPIKFYVGFDATADSLHVGHLLQIIVMKRLENAGHIPAVLLGTGTTVVGDPTGKSDMRKLLSRDDINANAARFKEQIGRFLDIGGKSEILYNGDWLLKLNYLEFLRDVGRHFSVNKMLTAECFKTRLERGLSFLEFNYMLLQSYDFLHMYKNNGVTYQFGGDDQWSNMLGGVDLIRRANAYEAENGTDGTDTNPSHTDNRPPANCVTFSLLTTKDGKKMGKTEKGAVWLDRDKCSVYDFYQYFRNIDDASVIRVLKFLTFIDVEEIERIERDLDNYGINNAKELLAFEVTKSVHGAEEAEKAKAAARAFFASGGNGGDTPAVTVSAASMSVTDLLTETGLCGSRRDARTNITQGGVSVNGEKVTDPDAVFEVTADGLILKKGKKNFKKAVFGV